MLFKKSVYTVLFCQQEITIQARPAPSGGRTGPSARRFLRDSCEQN